MFHLKEMNMKSYFGEVFAKVADELDRQYPHGIGFDSSSASRSPSLLWRGDSVVLGQEFPRWVWRLRVLESPDSENREIGFVNVRPFCIDDHNQKHFRFTADAFLAPPLRMIQSGNGYQIYLEADYGALYGEDIAEHVTCFTMPYRPSGGACVPACIYMLCTMLNNQGVYVPTPHEVSLICKGLKQEESGPVFTISSMTQYETQSVLDSDFIGARGLLFQEKVRGCKRPKVAADKAIYLIEQLLRSHRPVIMYVDCAKLYPEYLEELRAIEPSYSEREVFGHAIVIIGARYKYKDSCRSYLPEAFIFHDPLMGPYIEKNATDLIEAGFFDNDQDHVIFLTLSPNKVNLTINNMMEEYTRFFSCEKNGEIKSHGVADRIAQFNLIHRDDFLETYFSSFDHVATDFIKFNNNISNLPSWMWVIELFDDLPLLSEDLASSIFISDATDEFKKKHFHASNIFAHYCDGKIQCWNNEIKFPEPPVATLIKIRRKGIDICKSLL